MAESNVPVSSDDIPELTPDDRLRAVAAIFAAGISRLKARAACGVANSDEPVVVIEKPLEDGREPLLSVHAG